MGEGENEGVGRKGTPVREGGGGREALAEDGVEVRGKVKPREVLRAKNLASERPSQINRLQAARRYKPYYLLSSS